jgi:hypothetical protein
MATKLADVTGLGFDPRFGQLDTRGMPGIEEQREESWVDDRFGGMVNTPDLNLRKALTDMAETEGKDADVAHILEEAGIENPSAPATVYIAGKPFTVQYEQGLWRGEGVLDHKRHRLTAKSRDELLGKFMALARKTKKEAIRELSETELRQVALTAQRDRVQAINLYLTYAFPEDFADENDATEIAHDPRYADFLSEVCSYVWFNSRLDVSDSQEWRDFAAEFCADRPISCALLDNAWKCFAESRNRLVFAEPPRDETQPATPESLDDLDDQAIDKLLKGTKREFVRTALAGRQ